MNTICPECGGPLKRIGVEDSDLLIEDKEGHIYVRIVGCGTCHKVYWFNKNNPIPAMKNP
jgi:uncharacterized protein with PIN domain